MFGKIQFKFIILLVACILLYTIVLLIIQLSSSSRIALIKNSSSQFFHAKHITMLGNTLLCIKSNQLYDSRPSLDSVQKTSYQLSLISMHELIFIEFIDIEPTAESGKIPMEGNYQINASGHIGVMTIIAKEGRWYGAVRFPNWGKGAWEPLKELTIRGENITFTRSVNNRVEQTKTGSPSYFTQQYAGSYSEGNAVIKGYYRREGAQYQWEARRIR